MNLIEQIAEAINTDDSDTAEDSQRIIDAYHQAPLREKLILDNVFISLCGWSLATLLQRKH